MPAYETSPNTIRTAINPGIPAYSYGSFNDRNPGARMQVTQVALATDVVTLSVKMLEGLLPVVGQLVTVNGTVAGGGAANVTNVAIASVTLDANGVGTITYDVTHGDIAATPDGGQAFAPPPEVPEAMVVGSGQQFACISVSGLASNSRDVTWATETPSAPDSYTANLEGSIVDEDDQYVVLDTMSAPGNQTVLGVRQNFLRISTPDVSGGSSPTIIAKILV